MSLTIRLFFLILIAFLNLETAYAAVSAPKPASKKSIKPFIVMLDPGHGGHDSGAIGQRDTQEKEVTLRIALKLAAQLNQKKGVKAYLTRYGDEYVGLRERTQMAQKKNADLFVSLHADSFKNTSARGASVYILSKKGASSAGAQWLANSENYVDKTIRPSQTDRVLASVLDDLTNSAMKERSASVASRILHHLGKEDKLHAQSVQKARFMVLKSPAIPSVLVEMAFISNPADEDRLLAPVKQQKITQALYVGISDYIHQYSKL